MTHQNSNFSEPQLQKALRMMEQRDELKTLEETKLYQILKPLLTFMKFSGLFYSRKSHSTDNKLKIWQRISAFQIFSSIISFLIILNLVRYIFAFGVVREFNDELFFKLILTVWWLECVCKTCSMFYVCKQKNCFYTFAINYEKSRSIENPKIKRCMVLNIFGAVFFIILNTIWTSYAVFGDSKEWFNHMLYPLTGDYRFLSVIICYLNTMVTVLPTILYKLLCLLVADELKNFAEEFETLVDDDGKFEGDLELYRNRHTELCKLVESMLFLTIINLISFTFFTNHKNLTQS